MWKPARLCIAEAQTLAMHRLSPAGFPDRWDDPAQYEDTADSLVLGSVPDDYGQAWHFRITVAAPACLGTVRNSVDDAAQIPASDDQLGPRAATGEVEVDETWVGGTQAGLRGSRQLSGSRQLKVEKRRWSS